MARNKVKFEKLYDWDGVVFGYKLGEYYLMKHYVWNNDYEWIINKTGECSYFDLEFSMLRDRGEVEVVLSCKLGKERLIELNSMEGK